jgi:hypothetical protein
MDGGGERITFDDIGACAVHISVCARAFV